MSGELSGKVAIVTGGASGIGCATVAALVGAGAAAAALDRDEGGVGEVVEEGAKTGGLSSPWLLIWPTPTGSRISSRVCLSVAPESTSWSTVPASREGARPCSSSTNRTETWSIAST